jgi:hypothetical protein
VVDKEEEEGQEVEVEGVVDSGAASLKHLHPRASGARRSFRA